MVLSTINPEGYWLWGEEWGRPLPPPAPPPTPRRLYPDPRDWRWCWGTHCCIFQHPGPRPHTHTHPRTQTYNQAAILFLGLFLHFLKSVKSRGWGWIVWVPGTVKDSAPTTVLHTARHRRSFRGEFILIHHLAFYPSIRQYIDLNINMSFILFLSVFVDPSIFSNYKLSIMFSWVFIINQF